MSATVDSDYQPGRVLKYTNKHTVRSEYGQYFNGIIASTVIHPSWLVACSSKPCTPTDLIAQSVADLALITFKNDLDSGVATAKMDISPSNAGDIVTASGYGCEDSSHLPPNPRYFKSMTTKVLSLTEASANSAAIDPLNPGLFRLTYAITPGASFGNTCNLSYPALCPGDSGRPLYRGYARAGQEYIVAINGAIEADAAGIARINYHTRLENGLGAMSPVVLWLKTLVPSPLADSMFGYAEPTQPADPSVTWTYVGHPSYARHIAACENGFVYALNADKALYVNKWYGDDSKWQHLGAAGTVSPHSVHRIFTAMPGA